MSEIIILTVAGPGDEPFVRENIALIRQLNPHAAYALYVVDNTMRPELAETTQGYLGAQVIAGLPQDASLPLACRGSYHHAAALNHFLRTHAVESPYFLVIDPDFYVLRPEWIRDVTAHMAQQGLRFFGAPWHPRWHIKYRYFPCVHFLCIDRRVPLETLDFLPNLHERFAKKEQNQKLRAARKQEKAARQPTLLQRARGRAARFKKHWQDTLWRLRPTIATSSDTGFRVHAQYAGLPSGLLQPVFTRPFITHPFFRIVNWCMERRLPDALCYTPKRKGYFTRRGFERFSLRIDKALQWEEFMWREVPFGVHLRRQNRSRDYEPSQDLAALSALLSSAEARR